MVMRLTCLGKVGQFFRLVDDNEINLLRLVLDGAICPADSFEFTIDHCMRLNAFKHE